MSEEKKKNSIKDRLAIINTKIQQLNNDVNSTDFSNVKNNIKIIKDTITEQKNKVTEITTQINNMERIIDDLTDNYEGKISNKLDGVPGNVSDIVDDIGDKSSLLGGSNYKHKYEKYKSRYLKLKNTTY